jgi:hypothetical protein
MGKLQFFGEVEKIKDKRLLQPKYIGCMYEELCQEQSYGRNVEYIDGGKSVFKILFSLGEDNKEVEEKRGEYEECDLIQPIKKIVQNVQLTCWGKGVEGIQHQRNQEEKDIRKGERLFGI